MDPSHFEFTGDEEKAMETTVTYLKYTKDEFTASSEQSLLHKNKEKLISWISVVGMKNTAQITKLCQENGVHRLSIQDILDVNQRPKSQQFENYLLLILKLPRFEDNKLTTEQISLVVKENSIISFQESDSKIFEHIKQRLSMDKGVIREKNEFYLLYTILESIADDYLKTLNNIETNISNINFKLNEEPSSLELDKLERCKRNIYFIKKSIYPIRDFTIKVENKEIVFSEDVTKYFYEIKDLCLTIIDDSDIISNAIESNVNLFFSIQGQRMSQVMKTLTVVATIFIPLTFIAGVYGMNFTNMPELNLKYGYVGSWIVFGL